MSLAEPRTKSGKMPLCWDCSSACRLSDTPRMRQSESVQSRGASGIPQSSCLVRLRPARPDSDGSTQGSKCPEQAVRAPAESLMTDKSGCNFLRLTAHGTPFCPCHVTTCRNRTSLRASVSNRPVSRSRSVFFIEDADDNANQSDQRRLHALGRILPPEILSPTRP